MTNRYGYNGGNEYEDEGELNYSNTFYRKYDAQIGRFTGVDMLAEDCAEINPYQYGFNNPVSFNDPMGDQPGNGGNGRMQKGSDGNYHANWVNEMSATHNSIYGNFYNPDFSGFWNNLFAALGPDAFNGEGKTQIIHNGSFGHWESYSFDSGLKGNTFESNSISQNLEGVGKIGRAHV